MVGGCTVPGCYYPQFFSHHVNSSVIKSMRVRGGRLLCEHADPGTTANRIECRLKCKKGWRNVNNVDVTMCTKGQVEALARIKNLTDVNLSSLHGSLRKTTNFTTDYLECQRKPLQTKLSLQKNVSSNASENNIGLITTSENNVEFTTLSENDLDETSIPNNQH